MMISHQRTSGLWRSFDERNWHLREPLCASLHSAISNKKKWIKYSRWIKNVRRPTLSRLSICSPFPFFLLFLWINLMRKELFSICENRKGVFWTTALFWKYSKNNFSNFCAHFLTEFSHFIFYICFMMKFQIKSVTPRKEEHTQIWKEILAPCREALAEKMSVQGIEFFKHSKSNALFFVFYVIKSL